MAERTKAAAPPAAADQKAVGGIVLLTAAGATFLAFLDATIVNIAFPTLQQAFPDKNVADLSWVLTTYGILFAALLTPAGRLADTLGRRRLFVVSVLVFGLASLAAALAPALEWLIAARLVQGAGAAGMIPSALGLVLGHTPPARRLVAVSLWSGAGGMAAAAGPSVGGLLLKAWDWPAVFLINVPLSLLLVVLTLRAVPADAPRDHKFPDVLGTILVIAGISLVVLGLSEGSAWGWTDWRIISALLAGIVLLAGAVLRSMRHPTPAIEISLWRSRTFAGTNVTSFFLGTGLFAWLLLAPLYLTEVWKYSALEAGLAISPGALMSMVASVVVGRRVPANRQRYVAAIGALVFAASAVWFFAAAGTEPHYLSVFMPINIISGIAIGMVLTAVSGLAATSLPPLQFAAGTGLLITARQLGGALGIAVMAAILTADAGADALLRVSLFAAATSLVAAVSALAIADRRSAPPESDVS